MNLLDNVTNWGHFPISNPVTGFDCRPPFLGGTKPVPRFKTLFRNKDLHVPLRFQLRIRGRCQQ